MLTIGLTGGIGSGKTTVMEMFVALGINVIDTDQLSRDVTQVGSPALLRIVEKFGEEILFADGSLNRSALRNIIFKHDEDRVWLERLLHPLIRDEMQRLVMQATSPYCIVVIPLLFETEPNPLIQRTLAVDVPVELQIKRTMQRDGISEEAAKAILKAQLNREERLQKADDVIYNDKSHAELREQVENLHKKYLSIASPA